MKEKKEFCFSWDILGEFGDSLTFIGKKHHSLSENGNI